MAAPLRKVLCAEVDWGLHDGPGIGFGAWIHLECGHALVTNSRRHIDQTKFATETPDEVGPTPLWVDYVAWTGGRKRCNDCAVAHSATRQGETE